MAGATLLGLLALIGGSEAEAESAFDADAVADDARETGADATAPRLRDS